MDWCGERGSTYFFEQRASHRPAKRYKKQPEELPHELRFAHLNPRVAAILASKEKEQKTIGEPLEAVAETPDSLTSKSLLPQINQTFSLIRQRLNSILSDDGGQRLLFAQAKESAITILQQLSKILYLFQKYRPNIPRSLEYQLLSGWKELTADTRYIQREWQILENKEKIAAQAMKSDQSSNYKSEEKSGTDVSPRAFDPEEEKRDLEGRRTKSKMLSSRTDCNDQGAGGQTPIDGAPSNRTESTAMPTILVPKNSKNAPTLKPKSRLEKYKLGVSNENPRRPSSVFGSRLLLNSGGKKLSFRADDGTSMMTESASECNKLIGNQQQGYYQVIQFQLSSKVCDEKGWILHSDAKDERARETVLEWATQQLQSVLRHKREHETLEKEAGNDKPAQIRFYGDHQRELLLKFKRTGSSRMSAKLLKGEMPVVPSMSPRPEGKLFMVTVADGSCTVFYPSGRPAIISSKNITGKAGFYTLVYDDAAESKMLACFTPSGRGSCYHDNGVVRFLATEAGGTMAEPSGLVSKRWNWLPNGGKLPVSIVVQLNQLVLLRCANQQQMQIMYTCHKEHAKFHVGVTEGAEQSPAREDMGHLISGMPFTSLAAKDFARPYKPKPQHLKTPKGKGMKGKSPKGPAASSEVMKVLDFPEPTENDAEADKDLFKLQRKVKNTVEDWLDHYKIAVGLGSHPVASVKDSPSKQRLVQSAKSSPGGGGVVVVESLATEVPQPTLNVRAPSAPPVCTGKDRPASSTKSEKPPTIGPCIILPQDQQLTVTFDEKTAQLEAATEQLNLARNTQYPSSLFSSSAVTLRSTRTKSAPHRISTASFDLLGASSIGLCPVALRMCALGEEQPMCRCSRHKIPYITDLEYDEFIRNNAPERQLIVISVVSSLYPASTKAEEMLENLHIERNRNRTRPCLQSRTDPFRILRYDIASAAEFSDRSQPLLLRRHNVVPGMFLIYEVGKLLFCDHIFNGYGNARKDFQKQMMATRRSANQGRSLPQDFKFSPQHGRRGPRAAWGGEIGGAGVDRHGSAGLTLEQSTLKRASLTSLSSGGSQDIPFNMHIRLTHSAITTARTLDNKYVLVG